MIPGSAWHFLCTNPCLQGMFSIEKFIVASNSEKRRWLQNKAVIINGERPGPDDPLDFPLEQLVFFPKGQRRITMI